MARTVKNKELNLLAALDRGRQRQKLSSGTIVFIILIAALVALVAVFYAYMMWRSEGLTERRDAAQAYVNAPETQHQYEVALANIEAAQRAQAQAGVVAGAVKSENSYPDISADDYKSIFRIAGGNMNMSEITYDRDTGTLSFLAKCHSATRIPIFIAALRSSGVFSDVRYEGYTGGTFTTPGEPVIASDGAIIPTQVTQTEYAFNVSCTVKTDAERAADGAAE
ncbi:MAG: hypothetical protein LBG82_02680 [Clostridiales Family XIII bacterium]|jgi:hypothetical protein|nr:hypothetical protein [Clostridiales Family XIII bacterium]